MTAEERTAVARCFAELMLVMPHRWKTDSDKKAALKLYCDSLDGLSAESIMQGARVLRVEGTIDNWFPTPPEWFDAAAEFEIKTLERTPVAGYLPPSEHEIARELAAAQDAHDAFVEECKLKGFDGLARLFEAIEVRHPSEDPDRPFCTNCADTGLYSGADGAERCQCAPDNPKIKAQALRYQRLRRLQRRQRRAGALQPGRAQKQLTHALDFG